MATTVAILQAKLEADNRGFLRAVGHADSTMHKVGRSIGLAAAAAGAAIATGLGITAKIGFDEFKKNAVVAAQTNAVIKSTGGVANVSAKHIQTLGLSMLKLSGIDDEVTRAGANVLLTFRGVRNEVGKGNDIFDQATTALADMTISLSHGTATADDMQAMAIKLGKALNDPIRGITALRRIGVQFTDSQEKTIKKLVESGHVMEAQKMILAELTAEFGGSAKAAGKTFPGQLNILKETFKNLAGDIVGRLLPALQGGINLMQRFVDFFGRIAHARSPVVALHIIFEGVKSAVVGLYKSIRGAFSKLLFGTGGLKPLKLPSGKIIELADTRHMGLVDQIKNGLANANWSAVGKKIGNSISGAITFGADKLNGILSSMLDWAKANTDKIAEVGILIAIGIVLKLTDPSFWAHHLDLLAGLILVLFPYGRLARGLGQIAGRLGGDIIVGLLAKLETISPLLAKWGLRFAIFFKGLPGRLKTVIVLAGATLVRLIGEGFRAAWGAFRDWVVVQALQLVLRIVEPFSHLPGKLGQWARDAKDRVNAELKKIHDRKVKVTVDISQALSYIAALKEHLALIASKNVTVTASGNQGAPGTASGGIVTRPQVRLVGEAGPEAIIPLKRGGAALAGVGGDTYNIGGVIFERDLLSFIENAQKKKRQRGG